MTNQIYIVQGSTGEYSDHTEWVIAAYRKEEEAQAHVAAATARARELKVDPGSDGRIKDWYQKRKSAERQNQFDPQMQIDYTGVYYTYYPVDLYTSFASYKAREAA